MIKTPKTNSSRENQRASGVSIDGDVGDADNMAPRPNEKEISHPATCSRDVDFAASVKQVAELASSIG